MNWTELLTAIGWDKYEVIATIINPVKKDEKTKKKMARF